MKNRKTAFGSISNKRIEQIAISINSTSENADADLSKRFQERYHKTAVEDEHLSSLQMAKSSYIKLKQSRISSQPNIISKPIIQNGAVRAVNLFEGKDISNSTVTCSSTKNQNIKDINNSYIKSKCVNSSFHGNVNSIFQEQPNPLTHLSNNFITPASGSGIIGASLKLTNRDTSNLNQLKLIVSEYDLPPSHPKPRPNTQSRKKRVGVYSHQHIDSNPDPKIEAKGGFTF